MTYTVTFRVHIANLVALKNALSTNMPLANVVHDSRGGSERVVTFTVSADSEEHASAVGRSELVAALGPLLSAEQPEFIEAHPG